MSEPKVRVPPTPQRNPRQRKPTRVPLKAGARVEIDGERAKLIRLVLIHLDGRERWIVQFTSDKTTAVRVLGE